MSDKTPEQIFLQWFDDDGEPAEEVTWCKDQILDSDVVYVRSDIAEDALREQTAKTIQMIAERNALGHALDEQTARIADLEALCEIQELNLNKCHQSNIGLNEQAHTLRARIAELEAAVDAAQIDEVTRLAKQAEWARVTLENEQLKAEIARLRTQLDEACHVKAGDRVAFDYAVLGEMHRLKAENARLREALRDISHGPVGYWNLPEHHAEVIQDFMKTADKALGLYQSPPPDYPAK